MEEIPRSSPRPLPLIVLAALLLAAIANTAFYAKAHKLDTDTKNSLQAQINTLKSSSQSVAYKKESLGLSLNDLSLEVPSTWSVYSFPAQVITAGSKNSYPTISLAPRAVMFGDTNFSQVDFRYYEGVRQDVWTDLKSNVPEGTIFSTETVLGTVAQVITYPLDNGEATKAGSGGKVYFLTLQPKGSSDEFTLRIDKQSKGDAQDEAAFSHLMQSLSLS